MILQLFLASAYSGTYPSIPGGDYAMLSFDGLVWQNLHPDPVNSVSPVTNGIRDPKRFFYTYNGITSWYRFYSDGNGATPTVYLEVATDVTLLNWNQVVALTTASSGADNYMDTLSVLEDVSGIHFMWTNDSTRAWNEIHPNSDDPSTWGTQANWSSITTAYDIHGTQMSMGDVFPIYTGSGYEMVACNGSGVYETRTSSSLMTGWSDPITPTVDSLLSTGELEGANKLSDGTYQLWVSNGNSLNYKQWTVSLPSLTSSWSSPRALSFVGYTGVDFNWILPSSTPITDPDQIKQLLYMLMQNNAPWLPSDASGSNLVFAANWGFIQNDHGWVTVQCGPQYPNGISRDTNDAKLSLPFPNSIYEYPVGTVLSAAGVPLSVLLIANSDYLGFFNEEAESWIENGQLNNQGTSLTFKYKAY